MVSCLRQALSRRGTCAHTSIPRAPGQNDGIRALYRPSIADTCFVMSSALSPLVQTSAGLSLPGVFAHCTASRAFRHCKKTGNCNPRVLAFPGLGVASHPRVRWRRCTGLCSMSAPGLGSQIGTPVPRRLPSPRRTARTQPNLAQ